MDVIQAILDGIAIAAVFNGAVAALVLINPRFFFDSYPKSIQKAAPEQMTKQEKKINGMVTALIVGICFLYSTTSLLHTGITGFWNLFFLEKEVDGSVFCPIKIRSERHRVPRVYMD